MLWMMGILWIHYDVTQGGPRNRVSKNEEEEEGEVETKEKK